MAVSDHPQHLRAISKRLWSTPLADGSIPFVRMPRRAVALLRRRSNPERIA